MAQNPVPYQPCSRNLICMSAFWMLKVLLLILQIAKRGSTGTWLLRPAWRAMFWAVTEAPARLEEMLPAWPVVPLAALMKPAAKQPHSGDHCAWAPGAAVNSSSPVASIPIIMTSSAVGGAGPVDWLAAS